ncbi:hypothetical protein EYF80_009306 [Liparis tanakae]|uniref:Uncharacterized protein n=1 Tax=Liparis tanakae TaxID=230148 RepID=A0A4Z2ISM4_9TELE|nr:hypothetical protein EYF80_009306 [Liparis tanakae]
MKQDEENNCHSVHRKVFECEDGIKEEGHCNKDTKRKSISLFKRSSSEASLAISWIKNSRSLSFLLSVSFSSFPFSFSFSCCSSSSHVSGGSSLTTAVEK